MTMYKNTRNGKLAELLGTHDGGATMRLLDTREQITVNAPTFKRWWRLTVIPRLEAPRKSVFELSDALKKLEKLFDFLNDTYYESALPRPVITIQSTPRAYGHCSTKKIWQSDGSAMYELNIGAEYLNRPEDHTAATLQHEMIHLYCREMNIDETCQNGRYHNTLFKQAAEARGLVIGYNRTIGHSSTEPSEDFKATLEAAGYTLGTPFYRATPGAHGASTGTGAGSNAGTGAEPEKRNKSLKYACPTCGQFIRSTNPDLNIICGVCGEPMLK